MSSSLSVDPASNQSPAALLGFLKQCQTSAARLKRPLLVSISLEVPALDPLAVLATIYEPGERHFYVERPTENLAIAGAEAVLEFSASGPERFERVQDFIDQTLASAIIVGDQGLPLSGPHFFTAFSFFNDVGASEPFASASVFVPRWQVATRGTGESRRTLAVANLQLGEDSDVEAACEKIWRAHQRFSGFALGAEALKLDDAQPPRVTLSELGGEAHYVAAVRRAVEQIEAGEFEKIVLARAKDLVSEVPLHPMQALHGLRQRFRECYAFSLANGQGQSFIGASPERLVRVHGGMLQTEALAGSSPRGTTEEEDAVFAAALLRSDKDRHEQRLVLDAIVRHLAPLGLQLEFDAVPGLRRLDNVQHLHTPVRAALPVGVRALDVISRLHPTPAVGGVPRVAACAGIRAIENFPRGLYAGALGWIDSRGNAEFFVGLRSALIDGAKARLYAGAGIVAGSQPEQELAETALKFEAMERALFATKA
ncbi:hypothetical protein AXK11_03945 [Cephaloticoccus primus]|uniref:isochorismate synthase n=1 Tax=Cephaloticoccus primus TaxID=1548207 RepID=A0A139SPM8_9BACT|nr:isochorismate synthase [Cephaloticoccus primus]KXU36517.1 hypothetical protein AXK11_03945 [Cephaloticoccus primus]